MSYEELRAFFAEGGYIDCGSKYAARYACLELLEKLGFRLGFNPAHFSGLFRYAYLCGHDNPFDDEVIHMCNQIGCNEETIQFASLSCEKTAAPLGPVPDFAVLF